MATIPQLSRYTTLCILSTLLAIATISLLLFSTSGENKTDNNYIYLSLAAPTIALAHHLFYFVAPFERWALAGLDEKEIEYHIVADEAPPPYIQNTSTQNTNTQNENATSRKVYVNATRQPISNTYNPLASSTLNILTLVLLAVCIGALALSTGTVAFIDTLDALAAEKQGELAQRVNNGDIGFGLGVLPAHCYSEVLPVETSVSLPVETSEAVPQVTNVPVIEEEKEEEKKKEEDSDQDAYTPIDPSAPPRPILFYQATLSLFQTIALGYMALTAMRIRTLHYEGDGSYAWAEDELEELGGEVVFEGDEEEEDWEVQWVRASEDSRADEEDKQL
ncbi:hypothetical protein CPB86DRAFT_791177 [Serendipita vermifera]|nr:hypothetical protein CPB86DRAFT_791177 [Serendipita vermifera]